MMSLLRCMVHVKSGNGEWSYKLTMILELATSAEELGGGKQSALGVSHGPAQALSQRQHSGWLPTVHTRPRTECH